MLRKVLNCALATIRDALGSLMSFINQLHNMKTIDLFTYPEDGQKKQACNIGLTRRIYIIVTRLATGLAAILRDSKSSIYRCSVWLFILLAVYLADVWIVGSLVAVATATQAWMDGGMSGIPNYNWGRFFFCNPCRAAYQLIFGGLPHNLISVWLKSNAAAVPIAAALLILARSWIKKQSLPHYSGDPSRGTAIWMNQHQITGVLRTGYRTRPHFRDRSCSGKMLRMPPPNETRYNSHVAVFGSSGSMKSRAYITNAIMQATLMGASVIVTDSKGVLYNRCAAFLESEGLHCKGLQHREHAELRPLQPAWRGQGRPGRPDADGHHHRQHRVAWWRQGQERCVLGPG